MTLSQVSVPLVSKSVTAILGYKLLTNQSNSDSPQTRRMRLMGPPTFLLLLSGVLVLTRTWAGESGVWRETTSAGAGGEEGTQPGDRLVGAQEPRGRRVSAPPRPRPLPLPCPRPVLTPLFPSQSPGPSSHPLGPPTAPFLFHDPLAPSSSPGPITLGPGNPRREEGSDRSQPLPALRLPLAEVFPHRRVPARP